MGKYSDDALRPQIEKNKRFHSICIVESSLMCQPIQPIIQVYLSEMTPNKVIKMVQLWILTDNS